MPFLTDLSLKYITEVGLWELTEELVFHSDELDEDYYVPIAYRTDLYSIPGPFRGFTFRTRKYPRPPVAHDAVCNGKLMKVSTRQPANLTRKQGDALIVEAMRSEKKPKPCPKTLIRVVNIGTRLGSWFARGKIAPREVK